MVIGIHFFLHSKNSGKWWPCSDSAAQSMFWQKSCHSSDHTSKFKTEKKEEEEEGRHHVFATSRRMGFPRLSCHVLLSKSGPHSLQLKALNEETELRMIMIHSLGLDSVGVTVLPSQAGRENEGNEMIYNNNIQWSTGAVLGTQCIQQLITITQILDFWGSLHVFFKSSWPWLSLDPAMPTKLISNRHFLKCPRSKYARGLFLLVFLSTQIRKYLD